MIDIGNKKFAKFSLPTEIIGDKVIICQRTHEYDEQLWQLIDSSRDFLRPYLFWVDDTQSIDNVREVTDIFERNFSRQDSFEYVFLDKHTRKLVGAGGIHTVSYMHRFAEFGYYLDKTATGHGYVTEVVNLLTKELFVRGIHRLIIICDVENKASAAVAERCGFVREGRMTGARFAYGEYRDQFLYAKINPQQDII